MSYTLLPGLRKLGLCAAWRANIISPLKYTCILHACYMCYSIILCSNVLHIVYKRMHWASYCSRHFSSTIIINLILHYNNININSTSKYVSPPSIFIVLNYYIFIHTPAFNAYTALNFWTAVGESKWYDKARGTDSGPETCCLRTCPLAVPALQPPPIFAQGSTASPEV